MSTDDLDRAVTAFLDEVQGAPWGTLSKSQIDFLLFKFLIDVGRVSLLDSDFEIANRLQTTTARVRGLRYRYEQRAVNDDPAVLARLVIPENFVFDTAGVEGKLRVSIRSKYLREYFAAALARRRAIALSETTPSVLVAPMRDFVEVLVGLSVSGDWIETPEGEKAQRQLVAELVGIRDAREYSSAVTGWRAAITGTVKFVADITKILEAAAPFVRHS
ncbi:MAG TPA: hypothetical protein VGC45_02860 [Gryllotalpicola sp.]